MRPSDLNSRQKVLLARIIQTHGNCLVGTVRRSHGRRMLEQFRDADDLRSVIQTLYEPDVVRLEKHYSAPANHRPAEGQRAP